MAAKQMDTLRVPQLGAAGRIAPTAEDSESDLLLPARSDADGRLDNHPTAHVGCPILRDTPASAAKEHTRGRSTLSVR